MTSSNDEKRQESRDVDRVHLPMAGPVSDNWTIVLVGVKKHDRLRFYGEYENLMRIDVVDFHASTPSEPSESNLLSKCPVPPKIASHFKFSCAQGHDVEVAH